MHYCRVAGMLGRVPVEETFASKARGWQRLGFPLDAGKSLFASCWVDNIYAASSSIHGATRILDDIEQHLQEKWQLSIKPSSRSCMVAAGSHDMPLDPSKWPVVTVFECLGHLLQQDGGIRACVSATKRSCWAAFWANFSNKRDHGLRVQVKCQVLIRAVTPIFRYRCTRWPAQRAVAREFDGVQNKMLATLQRTPRLPGELAHEYVRRRNHLASHQAKSMGRWSEIWYERVVLWKEHLERERNAHSWPAQTLHFRGRTFLQQVRAFNSSTSAAAGRTGTRALRGIVHARWQDGAHLCQTRLVPTHVRQRFEAYQEGVV